MLREDGELRRSESMVGFKRSKTLGKEGRTVESSDSVRLCFYIFDSLGAYLGGRSEISGKYGWLDKLKVVDKFVEGKIGSHLTKRALSRDEVEEIRISKAKGYGKVDPSSKAILLSKRRSLIFEELIEEFYGGKYIPGCAYDFIAYLPVKKEELSV